MRVAVSIQKLRVSGNEEERYDVLIIFEFLNIPSLRVARLLIGTH